MVRIFNCRLAEFCALHSLRFIDINKYITYGSGTVLEQYLVPDQSTIHVLWETTIQFWVKELVETGLVLEDIPSTLDATLETYEEHKKEQRERRSFSNCRLLCRLVASNSGVAPPFDAKPTRNSLSSWKTSPHSEVFSSSPCR